MICKWLLVQVCPAGELWGPGRVLVLQIILTVHQSDRQVDRQVGYNGSEELRLDQGSCVHQNFVGVQAGKEADVPVLVGLQSHDSLFQLIRVGTDRLLEVCFFHDSLS